MAIQNLAKHPCAFVSIDELSEYLGLGRSTLYEMAAHGDLPSVRIPGRRVILIPIIEARRLAGVYSDQDVPSSESRAS
jgi:excisionase family DNA binding protein